MGRRFTAILAAEWRGVISQSWNSMRLLVFAHVVLIKTFGIRRAREIRAGITRRMDLWEGDNMLAWWGTPRWKGLPVRAGPPSAVGRRTMP